MHLLRHMSANHEQLKELPFKRELSMEAYLIDNEGVLALDRDNYWDVSVVEAELTLKMGRQSKGTDGRIDMLVTYSNECLGVVELKLDQLNQSHLEQLEDYLLQKEQIAKMFPDLLGTDQPKWVGVLVGSDIDSELAIKINNGYQTENGVPIGALTIKRFKGERGDIYVTTDVFFNSSKTNKDFTKYKFDNQIFGKGKLVHAVVKKYVEQNKSQATLSHLNSVFAELGHKKYGVVSSKEDAEEVEAQTGYRRHFLKPEMIIELNEGIEIAVCNQWGVGNIAPFIERVKRLGYSIENA